MRRAALLLALSAVVASTTARADEAPKDPTPSDAGGPAPTSRERCLCSPERLVKLGKEMGRGAPLAAVLDDGDGSAVLTFAAAAFRDGASDVTDEGVGITLEPFAADALTSSKRRLFRVSLDPAATPPFLVGLVRKKETLPKDVVRVVEGGPETPASPVSLASLFVGPSEERTPRGCGTTTTRAVAFSERDGVVPLAGFLVETTRTDGATARAFVDERHARSFGLGRVDACDHGVGLDATVARLVVRPVGGDLVVGAPFTFALDTRVPTLVEGPADRDLDAENPFTRVLPGQEERFDDESDKAALGTMLGLVGAAAVLASMLWPALRRRRTVVEVACPACSAALTLDLADPAIDGGFCPRCGRASIFVSHRADGAPEARLFVLGEGAVARRRDGAPDDP